MRRISSVCVFCGSSSRVAEVHRNAATRLGTLVATHGMRLVYGGGRVGLMGLLADAALAAGGEVVGVIPQFLVDLEVAHTGLTELRVVDSMHARKQTMAELADAFVALPGGVGTFEEFFEAVTWTQLGLHRKACGLLDVEGFYTPLLGFIDRAVNEGFIKPIHRTAVVMDADAEALLSKLANAVVPDVPKWITVKET